jgi:hypothetical protein
LDFEVEYSINDILTGLMILRFYLIVRLGKYFTRYNSEKSERACAVYGYKTNTLFAIKSVLRDNPYTTVAVAFLFFTISTAYLLYIMERNDRDYTNGTIEESDLNTYWNGIWLSFVTSSTVGYGEMYPYTHFGRFVVLVISIVGNFFLGLFVVALAASLDHDDDEWIAYVDILK